MSIAGARREVRAAREQPGAGALPALAWVLSRPSLLVGLLAWALYLPAAATVVQISPDVAEYVDVARRVATGEGYLLGIKSYHIAGPDVISDGMFHRPPLFTLLMAGVLALGLPLTAAQVVNAAMGAVSVAMVCSIGTALLGGRIGLVAGLLAALSPIALEQQVLLLSDPVATACTLVGVRLVLGACQGSGWRLALLAGLAFGLGYLARPPVLVVGVALALVLPFVLRDRARARGVLAALLGGMALVVVPMTMYSLLTRGRLSYSGKGYLYGVVSDADIMENGYTDPIRTPLEFITSRPGWVAEAIWNSASLYAHGLFLEREWLLPLLLGWPGALYALVRGRYPRECWIPLTAAAVSFGFYAITWSSWQDRFMLPTLFLILPFGVDGSVRGVQAVLARLPLPAVHVPSAGQQTAILGVLTLVAAILWLPRHLTQWQGQYRYGERPASTRVTEGVRWTGPPRWVNDGSLEEAIEWIRGNTSADTVLAHGQPWPYTFFTRRPTVLLPYKLSDERLRDFLTEYRVSYVLYDPRDPQRRGYQDQLRALSSAGVRSTRVENLVVYDTRPLWQGR